MLKSTLVSNPTNNAKLGDKKLLVVGMILVLVLVILSVGVLWQLDRENLKAELDALRAKDRLLADDLIAVRADLTGAKDAFLLSLIHISEPTRPY